MCGYNNLLSLLFYPTTLWNLFLCGSIQYNCINIFHHLILVKICRIFTLLLALSFAISCTSTDRISTLFFAMEWCLTLTPPQLKPQFIYLNSFRHIKYIENHIIQACVGGCKHKAHTFTNSHISCHQPSLNLYFLVHALGLIRTNQRKIIKWHQPVDNLILLIILNGYIHFNINLPCIVVICWWPSHLWLFEQV